MIHFNDNDWHCHTRINKMVSQQKRIVPCLIEIKTHKKAQWKFTNLLSLSVDRDNEIHFFSLLHKQHYALTFISWWKWQIIVLNLNFFFGWVLSAYWCRFGEISIHLKWWHFDPDFPWTLQDVKKIRRQHCKNPSPCTWHQKAQLSTIN